MSEGEVRKNPLLSRVRIPGETYTLPSRGLFYTNGELDESAKNGEVTINPMTAVDEITIRTPDKLFSGEGIKDVFAHCIPQVLKPTELFAKDVDFLMCCLRKVSYGPEFEVTFQHDCETEVKKEDGTIEIKKGMPHSYIIRVDELIKKSRKLDPTTVESQFRLTLENKQVVAFEPIRYKHIIKLMQAAGTNPDQGISPEILQDQMFSVLLSAIKQVDDVTEKEFIDEWLHAIKVAWAHQISNKIDTIQDWGPIFEVNLPCKDCGEEVNVAAPLNPINFFISS